MRLKVLLIPAAIIGGLMLAMSIFLIRLTMRDKRK